MAIARRITAMSLAEIRFRTIMLLRQRMDLWEAGRGKNPLDPRRKLAPPGKKPRFFFDPGEVHLIATAIRERLPMETEGVTESALRTLNGVFDLLGYEGLSFGRDQIDWHLDPVHKIRAPFLPWFRVPYLDFAKTGDHKIIWELSRHQHLTLLARAWLFTGDIRYLQGLERIWRSWRESNPYPLGINWASTLEVAFRCLSWIWIDQLTSEQHEFPADLRRELRQSIGESAVYIERYISAYFSPNTHLLGEALALFFVGVLYPEFERSSFWRDYGWRVLQQEADRQVRSDGFHFEQSVYYHVYALDMFLYARVLASRNDIAVPPEYDAVLMRMADALASIGSGGQAPAFGDDDGGRLFDGRRNRREHMLDPLPAAAVLFGRPDWKALAGPVREETMWVLGLSGIEQFDHLPEDPGHWRSRAFRASGYYVLKSSDAVLVADAGPHGWARGGHGHADALSFQVLARGHSWLTDPGTYSYPSEKPDRNLFRSTAAHNTLAVDEVSQADPVHSFAWNRLPQTTVHRWHEGREFTLFHGSHDGYQRLENPVTHSRWIIAWPDGVWLVRDLASGEGAHKIGISWLVSPDCSLAPGRQWLLTDGCNTLAFCASRMSGWTAASGEALWSPAYGAAVLTPALRLSYDGPLPAECVALGAWNQSEWVLIGPGAAKDVSVWGARHANHSRIVIFSNGTGSWSFEGLESDTELIGFDFVEDALVHFFCSGGTNVSLNGDPVLLPPSENDICEWRVGDESRLAPQGQIRKWLAQLDLLQRSCEAESPHTP
jgi:hypothetical protein